MCGGFHVLIPERVSGPCNIWTPYIVGSGFFFSLWQWNCNTLCLLFHQPYTAICRVLNASVKICNKPSVLKQPLLLFTLETMELWLLDAWIAPHRQDCKRRQKNVNSTQNPEFSFHEMKIPVENRPVQFKSLRQNVAILDKIKIKSGNTALITKLS